MSAEKWNSQVIRYMGFVFVTFSWCWPTNAVSLLLFWVWYIASMSPETKPESSFGLLKEFCVLLSFNLALNSACCGSTYLSHQLQPVFTYVQLYPVIQQFCSNALIHWTPGAVFNISHNSADRMQVHTLEIHYGKTLHQERAGQPFMQLL